MKSCIARDMHLLIYYTTLPTLGNATGYDKHQNIFRGG